MTPFKEWEPILGLPDTLEKLLQETEINNSFRESTVTDSLKNTMESSYAFLYRMQKDSVNYSRFHFQTREFLLNTTYNDIHMGLKKYGDMLMELLKSENPDMDEVAKLKRTLAEFGEVRFGDIYLDEKRRVSMNVEHDIIAPETREVFRTSKFYMVNSTLTTLLNNGNIFKEIPIAIVDGEVRLDISVYPLEQGTKIIFNHMTAKDVYTNTEKQIFHDVCIMFIPNTILTTNLLSKDDILTGAIPMNFDLQKNRKGMYFVVVKGEKHSTHLIPTTQTDTGLSFVVDKNLTDILELSDGNFEVSCIFFQDLYKLNFAMTEDGSIPTKNRFCYTETEGKEYPKSYMFIPRINGDMLTMPIPEENMMVMKAIYEGTSIDRYEPTYQVSVDIFYPNIYQINDPNQTLADKYDIYFFYKEVPEIKYTPLFDFYWDYLRSRFNNLYTMEEVINKIYFREDGFENNLYLNSVKDSLNEDDLQKITMSQEMSEAFYTLFEKMIAYKDYNYHYSTPDFISDYKGEEIPLQYKISRMMEFIRADWKVLPNYVKKERVKESTFHFFTNTINISGRFRRSTRLEDRENAHFMFAEGCKLTTAENENAYLVVDKSNYDINHEVRIDDVKLILPSVSVGDYVEFTDLVNRYVFAFKNPGEDYLAMKVFIDGLLCTDVVTINSLGMDYIYLPVDSVKENSYIMMELEWSAEDPQLETLEFTDNEETKHIHLIEYFHVEYTVNDVVLKVNGETLDEDKYTIKLIRNEVEYDMTDERHGVTNKYGIVTDVSIQLTNVTEFPVTVDVQINKTSIVASGKAVRNGYPRFNLPPLHLNPDIKYARMYFNGRLAPTTTFRLVDSTNRSYIQSRIFHRRGDQFLFEFSPYAKEIICQFEEFDPNEVIDFSKYIDKPLDPEYYEVYVNGRRLGLPNLFAFGPHHAVFRGIKSKYLLDIFEKERDFEYFGYSKILKDGEAYYYLPHDLLKEKFMSDVEANRIIDAYIEKVKHEDAIILPNDPTEEPVIYDIEYGLIEEMKIFFFEELLPLGLGNPDELQFNKTYFSEVFPDFTKEFIQEGVEDGPDVIFLNPDVTARIYDAKTNDYEIIDTKDADPDKAFVMLTGESK